MLFRGFFAVISGVALLAGAAAVSANEEEMSLDEYNKHYWLCYNDAERIASEHPETWMVVYRQCMEARGLFDDGKRHFKS